MLLQILDTFLVMINYFSMHMCPDAYKKSSCNFASFNLSIANLMNGSIILNTYIPNLYYFGINNQMARIKLYKLFFTPQIFQPYSAKTL